MLLILAEFWSDINQFLKSGGLVLVSIAIVLGAMWTLIFERLIYMNATFPRYSRLVVARWEARADRTSWAAHRIRDAWISEAKLQLTWGIPLIKTLVAICPLMGLLGTVTGMIEVFDVMAYQGTGNARSMAEGISRATIPTMAGMVAALSGVFMSTQIERSAEVKAEYLADAMPHH
ncbi:MAG: MotA/TolQ/ExbB proton channel family protein [Pseudomonadota bacterium]